METQFSDSMVELCAWVDQALKDLPNPEPTSREELLSHDYLWRLEIYLTCGQLVEYFRSIKLLISEGLYRPAAALSRSVHECTVRFDYLANNENELRDWIEWQWSRDYHQYHDELRYGDVLGAERAWVLQERMKSIVFLMGEAPPKRNHPWKRLSDMLKYSYRDSESGHDRRHYRWFIANLSQYVHIGHSDVPSPELTDMLTAISVVSTFGRAMRLCKDKQVIDPPAAEIVALCERTLMKMKENIATQIEVVQTQSTSRHSLDDLGK